MASSITSITKVAPGHWRYVWTGTSPYYVYKDGHLFFNATTRTEWIFDNTSNYEPPVIEVRDSTEATTTIEQLNNPPYATLQWFMAANAAYYIIQEYVTVGSSGSWVTRKNLFEDGSEYYTYQTPVLDDVTTATWRVLAVDKHNTYNPVTFEIYMVRNPDPPDIALSYSAATGNLTVSAR